MIEDAGNHGSFIMLMRGPDTENLMRDPKAYTLLSLIAYRARRGSWGTDGIKCGDALIGDYESVGLTEKEYRTAKKRLSIGQFCSFKGQAQGRTRGTIATLLNSRVFDINADKKGEQKDAQRASEGRLTRSKEEIKRNNNNTDVLTTIGKKPLKRSFWMWLLNKCDNNDYDAARILYRARRSQNLEAYIHAGFQRGYITTPCKDEENDPRKVNDDIDRLLSLITEKEKKR
jgi:hypothetical protein